MLTQGKDDASEYEFRGLVVQKHFPALTAETFAEALKKQKGRRKRRKNATDLSIAASFGLNDVLSAG